MKPRPTASAPSTPRLGSVRADELLPLEELGRRLGLGSKSLSAIQRAGLQTVTFGKRKYVAGRDVLTFFNQLAARTPADQAPAREVAELEREGV